MSVIMASVVSMPVCGASHGETAISESVILASVVSVSVCGASHTRRPLLCL